ncbi:MAG: radical SAM protein [Bryobacteraceae bacterium]
MDPPLIGIARLAHSAATLEAKRAVEYRELPSFQLLNRCTSSRVFFEWTINPYRGCEFACRYCYARYTHEFMELRDPALFDNRIFAKQWNPADFQAALRRLAPGQRIAIGTATDPYQPAERRYGLTRRVLEALAARKGLAVFITTKSDLVARDLDILAVLARQHRLRVHFTVTTVDAELARRIEPRAPRPDLRLGALAALATAGIETGVSCAPVLPLLTDSPASLDALAASSARAGAKWMGGGTVFLREPARQVFLEFLDREFPALAAKYRQRFSRSAYLRGDYVEMAQERIEEARRRHGLGSRPGDDPIPGPQLELDFGGDMLASA